MCRYKNWSNDSEFQKHFRKKDDESSVLFSSFKKFKQTNDQAFSFFETRFVSNNAIVFQREIFKSNKFSSIRKNQKIYDKTFSFFESRFVSINAIIFQNEIFLSNKISSMSKFNKLKLMIRRFRFSKRVLFLSTQLLLIAKFLKQYSKMKSICFEKIDECRCFQFTNLISCRK